MAQEIEVRKTGFRRWFAAGLGTETLAIIPPTATLREVSKVKLEDRGKTPGIRHSDGSWIGLYGQWSDDMIASVDDARQWVSWGASVGLQSRKFPGLDIDVEDQDIAATIEGLALEYLGIAPIRVRTGSPRRLLVYARAEGAAVIRKSRFAWIDGKGVKHAVELLGHGQQYVVEGPHPKGGAYAWRHGESPCEYGRDNLTPIAPADIDEFFAALRTLVDDFGWGEPVKNNSASATSTLGGRRHRLDDANLWAPRPEMVVAALDAWPNTAENLPAHDDFVAALAAIKASLGPERESYYGDVEQWALGFDGNDEDYVRKTWDSINDAALGAEWLFQQARATGKFTEDAQADFDDGASEDDNEEDEEEPAAKSEYEKNNPVDRMLARYVWVQQLERYVDLQSGSVLSGRAFNSANVNIAEFGRSGVNSAEATFQNSNDARKAAIVTYRPGAEVITTEENEFGVRVKAVNLWRPSTLEKIEGPIDDDTVKPWLDHVTEIFGEPGDPAREHFLDWCGYALQKPGKKINHALVLLGEHGVGKDTVFVPIFAAIGQHNIATIKTETLAGQWTHFLQSQFVVVQEMMNFVRRETYNRMKDWIATPPLRLEVNRKNQNQYTVPNIQQWVIFTNHEDAIALDEGDRRFWVHRACLETPKTPAYYTTLYSWFDEGRGSAKVAAWLRARDVSSFNASAPPPLTLAKRQMIDHALPPATRWLVEQFEEGGAFHGREFMTTRELFVYARSAFDGPVSVQEKHATAALRRAGFKTLEKKMRIDGSTPARIWTTRAVHVIESQEARIVAGLYQRDAASREAQKKGA